MYVFILYEYADRLKDLSPTIRTTTVYTQPLLPGRGCTRWTPPAVDAAPAVATPVNRDPEKLLPHYTLEHACIAIVTLLEVVVLVAVELTTSVYSDRR